jgi:lysophospholipase L1-like esterase
MRHTKLAEERPDFILVQLGTNDVRVDGDATSTEAFTNNLREIIGIFRSFKSRSGREPKILLATIPPVPEGTPLPFSAQSVRRVKDEVNPAIADVAVKERLALVDNYALFFNAPHLLADVHPTQDGYRALAQNWFTALRPFLKPAR